MRSNWTISSDKQLHIELKELSKNERIPVSRLIDEALEDLFVKHKDNYKYTKVFEVTGESEKWTVTVENETKNIMKTLSETTRIPMKLLFDEAIGDLILKYKNNKHR